MKHLLIALATVVLAAQVIAQETPKAKNPAAALQGTWVVTSINGQTRPRGFPGNDADIHR